MGIVADVCQSFVFDNGALSVWKKGGKLDVDGYTAWVEQWLRHPGLDWALIPDVIEGDESANDPLLEAWPRELRGVPVWHLHESLDRLQRWPSIGRQWPSAVRANGYTRERPPGGSAWVRRWMQSAITRAGQHAASKDSGCSTLRYSRISPSRQADCTNAAVNGGSISQFCMYVPP